MEIALRVGQFWSEISDQIALHSVQLPLLTNAKQFNSSFSLLHVNSRSLVGNFDKFQSLISSLNKPFSAIGVSETWLNDLTCDSVNISGYNFISNRRSTKTGGGVGIYLQDFLQYKLLHNCN